MNKKELGAVFDSARQIAGILNVLIVRRLAEGGIKAWRKDDQTWVTDVDLEVEKKACELIGSRHPEHSILGEEFGEESRGSPWQWIIDPIDGTRNFRAGSMLFGTLLAVRYEGHPVVGIIDHPALRVQLAAAKGRGAFRGHKQWLLPHVKAAERDLLVAIGDFEQFRQEGREALLQRLLEHFVYVRTYTDCHGHTSALLGTVSAMVDPGLRLWDYAATEVIAREAGAEMLMLPNKTAPEKRDIILGQPEVVELIASLAA